MSEHDAEQPQQEEITWVEVATTVGLTPAQIIADRLKSEGLRAYAWQQGAGQAYGLTVGPMGAGHVMVAAEDADRARELLGDDEDEEWEWEYTTECPHCGTELVLDEEEVENGRFVCPECGEEVELAP